MAARPAGSRELYAKVGVVGRGSRGGVGLSWRSCRGRIRGGGPGLSGTLLKHVQLARAREGAQVYLCIATNGHVVEYEMAAQRDLTSCPFKVRRGEITRILVQLDDQLGPA